MRKPYIELETNFSIANQDCSYVMTAGINPCPVLFENAAGMVEKQLAELEDTKLSEFVKKRVDFDAVEVNVMEKCSPESYNAVKEGKYPLDELTLGDLVSRRISFTVRERSQVKRLKPVFKLCRRICKKLDEYLHMINDFGSTGTDEWYQNPPEQADE